MVWMSVSGWVCVRQVGSEVKQEIWMMATQNAAPLVQRVSKSVMTVKCAITPSHPLGFLHLWLEHARKRQSPDYGFWCTCSGSMPGQVKLSVARSVHQHYVRLSLFPGAEELLLALCPHLCNYFMS